MQICCIHESAQHPLTERLQGLGHHLQVVKPGKIRSLTGKSANLVYVVPYEMLEDPGWAEWRVTLARGSRYYIVMGDNLSTYRIMEAARDGAFDVVDTVDTDERLNSALEHAARAQDLWWQLYGSAEEAGEQILVGRSSAMRSLRESIQRIGPTMASVLILGESGTGKERVAESVQRAFGRGNLVIVNCAAIPEELMESELFGAEKGAFTGAVKSKPGLVEEADGGTLFLDEIGEMDLSLQPKLLRFLENGTARRVGSTRDYQVDVRVISATNRDLKTDSDLGRFRLDLYYRLSEVILNVAPLRHRPDDIPDLAMLFLQQAAVRMGKNFESIEPELIQKFQQFSWPGNVRELKQHIERLVIHFNGPIVRADWWVSPEASLGTDQQAGSTSFPGMALQTRTGKTQFPFSPSPETQASGQSLQAPRVGDTLASRGSAGPRGGPLNRREKLDLARQLLDESDNDLTWTAGQLGIHPTTLYRWRKMGKV